MKSLRSKRIRAAALALLAAHSAATLAVDRTALPPAASFTQDGFEVPDLPANTYTSTPAGSAWTFSGTAGITTNGSAITPPAAAQGDQTAWLRGGSTVNRTFTTPAGNYRLSFKTQRGATSSQGMQLRVDSTYFATITPTIGAWGTHNHTLTLTAGSHTLQFLGTGGSGETAYLDDFTFEPLGVLNEGGFEVPDRPANTFQYNQTGSAWTFEGGSGISTNNAGWTTTLAPEGDQFAFLQGGPTTIVRQAVTTTAGKYRLSLKAAQRAGANQTVRITIDGFEVGSINPASTNFSAFEFDSLSLAAGSHTIAFIAQNGAGDHSAFIDDVKLTPILGNARLWSDPATWGGTLPQPGDKAIIPAGSVVLLDTTVTTDANGDPNGSTTGGYLKDVQVEGELHCADQNIQLSAESIMVQGRLTCGSPYSRYVNNFTLTLRGTRQPGSGSNMGNKVLAAMGSGVIELHGETRKSWTQLGATANPGATQINVVGANQWRTGDKLVLAPTGNESGEAEVVTVASVQNSGTTINFTPALQYKHYGLSSQWSNGTNTWLLDERGEVGLLTRNILIQGDSRSNADNDSDGKPDGFGGHFMSMVGTQVHVSGIGLHRMGQKAIKARYPFHWHLVGDAPGQYIENSSVYESYNRCIVVHQTNKVRVAGNVCHDFIGHGYFLEDGNEQFNVFDGNLGVGSKRPVVPNPLPPAGELPLPTDYRESLASNGPAVFWISHPNNTVINNVAAGSQGAGYWYHLEYDTTYANPAPNIAPFGRFYFNRVHSSRQGFTSCRDDGGGAGMDSVNALVERLTVSNVRQGIWPCAIDALKMNTTFKSTIVANAENGMQSPAPMTFKDSMFLAYSANEPPGANPANDTLWTAIAIYDQGFVLDNVHFVNYDRDQMSVFTTVGGAFKVPNNRVKGLTFDNSPHVFTDFWDAWQPGYVPTGWGEPIYDLDGSFTGTPDYSMTSTHPLMNDATCFRPTNVGFRGYACPYRFAQFRIDTPLSGPEAALGGADDVTVMRSDGVSDTFAHEPFRLRFLHQFIANKSGTPYSYLYRYVGGIPRNYIWPAVVWGRPGDASVHEIMDVPANYVITDSNWSPAAGVTDLENGAGNRYYYRNDTNSLLLKFIGTGNDWNTVNGSAICLVPLVGGQCPAGPRNPQSPSVEITSPDRSATGTFNITATASANFGTLQSVSLFLNDEPAVTLTAPPFQFALTNRRTGVYIVKVVAKNSVGASYTALQRLVVGEPEPRIAILNVVNNGTYSTLTFPGAVLYNAINPSVTAPKVRWIFDNKDRGEVTGGSITVPPALLTTGRHDITVAYAKTDGSVQAVGAKARFYIVANGEIADFEDGRDSRITFTQHGANSKRAGWMEWGWAWGVPSTTRIDNQDDINYFDTHYVDGSGNPAKIRLTLAPQEDWTAFQRVEVVHGGPGFGVTLLRANGTQIPLAWTSNVGNSSYFNLPVSGKNDVVGLELQQPEPPAASCAANPTIPGVCAFRQHIWSIKLLP